MISGFVAKKACSCINVGNQSQELIKKRDFGSLPLSLATLEVSKDKQTVSSSIFGLYRRTAIHRPGLGCALLQGQDDYRITKLSPEKQAIPIPRPTQVPDLRLDRAVELAFDVGEKWEKKTSALLVVKKDKILREHYALGYDRYTKFLGWSMAKSVCNLLVGIMVSEGQLDLEKDKLYPAWEKDERQKIKLKNLLKMNSGLQWTEQYGSISDITQGLFSEEDFVRFTFEKELEHPIGSQWEYASGTTNLISGIIKRQFEEYQSYLDFPHSALFSKLGMDAPIMETDEAGNYIMSSYMWATARDWAKLGQLYLDRGKWKGEQLIDSSYMQWSTEPASCSDVYGAQVWLNLEQEKFPDAPKDMYWFGGYNGQYVIIIPSEELIVVRLGQNKEAPFDMAEVLKEIMDKL